MDEFSNIYADFKAELDHFHMDRGFICKYFPSNSWYYPSTIVLHKSFFGVDFGFWSLFDAFNLFSAQEIFFSRFLNLTRGSSD